jgi:hypothetical protein
MRTEVGDEMEASGGETEALNPRKQVREGLEAIRGGLGIAAGGATTAFQDSVRQALGSAEALVGPKALESRLW